MHGLRSSLRLGAVAFTMLVLAGTLLPVLPAGADTVSDKQAQAARLAAEIEADNQQVDSLTTRFEGAQQAAAEADARLAASTAALQAVERRIDETRLAVRDLAVDEFMNGRPSATPVPVALEPGDVRGATLSRFFTDLAISKTQEVLDANKAAKEDYQSRLTQLRAEQQRAHEIAAGLQASRAAAEAAVARQQANLDKVRGDLATLVAAERARLAAEREAQARASVAPNVVPPRPAGAPPPPAAPTKPAPPVDGSRAGAAVAEARRQLGKPYHWGGAGPDSFDCSGLTMWAWRAGGVQLDHYTGSQYNATTHIPLSELQPGDLVFFHSDLSHVGIYVGNGQMIHAPQTGDVVKYSSIYSEGGPIYAGRVTG